MYQDNIYPVANPIAKIGSQTASPFCNSNRAVRMPLSNGKIEWGTPYQENYQGNYQNGNALKLISANPLQAPQTRYRYMNSVSQAGPVKIPNFNARPDVTVDRVAGVNANTDIGAKILRAFGGTPKTDYIVPPHVASLARSIYVKV